MLKTHRLDEWDKFLTSLDTQDGSLYKLNKNLLKKTPASLPLTSPHGPIYTANEKSELFADTFEKQFSPNPGPDLPEVSASIQYIDSSPHYFTSPGQISDIIKHLPKRKSPGEDTISNSALKFLPKNTILLLTHVFNSCIRLGYFPDLWKCSTIITIPKPSKDHGLPENYRPISLLSSISKIFEKILLQMLKPIIDPKIKNQQFAFRPQHSTTLQLVKLVDQQCLNNNNRQKTAAIFLDVEKAFDRVWHDGLLHKLLLMGTPIQLLKIIKSFLTDRTFKFRTDNYLSSSRPIRAGVPQGSSLSPLLYLVFTNNIPVQPNASVSLFADDTMFCSQNRNSTRAILQLQRQTNLATKWFQTWRLKINTRKTITIMFNCKHPPREINLNGHPIKWSNHVKYLGIYIDKNLTFTKHITETVRKATLVRSILYPVINCKSPIPTLNKLQIIQMYIRSILTYAGPAWGPLISNSN